MRVSSAFSVRLAATIRNNDQSIRPARQLGSVSRDGPSAQASIYFGGTEFHVSLIIVQHLNGKPLSIAVTDLEGCSPLQPREENIALIGFGRRPGTGAALESEPTL
jgi:hypothetical protein